MNGRTAESLSRKLLAVSWAMPPLLLPRAIQVPRTLKALSSFGWETTVLCAETAVIDKTLPQDEKLKELSAGGYKSIIIKPPRAYRPLHSPWGYKLLRKLDLVDEVWQRWTTRAALGLLKREAYHALITFAQPWTDHLIGLEVRRRTRIPWVAHFSDPWVDSPYIDKNDRRYPAWCSQEAGVVKEADAVIFTTAHTADLVMRKYPSEYRQKTYVVPHGFDPDFGQLALQETRNTKLRMVSTGNFYRSRTPIPLLKALDELRRAQPLDDLSVILTGGNNLPYAEVARSMGLGNVVTCQDSVPFLESLRIAASANVLLVIDAPSDGASVFLPSKLIDYLMFQRPILGITPLEGSSADLLRRADCPVAAPDDIPGIAQAVKGLLAKWQLGALAVSPAFAAVAREYEINETTRVLDVVLQQIGRRQRAL